MNWTKGFTSQYYAYLLDPATWRETELLEITGGRISRNLDGLRDACDIDIVGSLSGERWIRVYMDTTQDGASEHVPLFTGLTSNPERNIEGRYEENTLQCFSVLKPCQDILLDRGYYVPADIAGDIIIKNLLAVTPARVEVNGEAPALRRAIIAEEGETHLSMIDKVLEALNWRMRLKGDGTIELCPMPLTESIEFNPLENDIVEMSISLSYDWYQCPNVFRAVQGDLAAIARDDNPLSPMSTVSRGREVWMEDNNAELNTGESIEEFAIRKLKEEQRVSLTASYTRRFEPNLVAGDLIRSRYEQLDGLFRITSQTIEIGMGSATEEEVESHE